MLPGLRARHWRVGGNPGARLGERAGAGAAKADAAGGFVVLAGAGRAAGAGRDAGGERRQRGEFAGAEGFEQGLELLQQQGDGSAEEEFDERGQGSAGGAEYGVWGVPDGGC